MKIGCNSFDCLVEPGRPEVKAVPMRKDEAYSRLLGIRQSLDLISDGVQIQLQCAEARQHIDDLLRFVEAMSGAAADESSTSNPDMAGEREAFEGRVIREVGDGAAVKWLGTPAYENTRVQDYRTGWVWCLEWLRTDGEPDNG